MWAYWEHFKQKQHPTNSNWGNAIKDLEKESGSDKKVVAALDQIRTLHRNPVVHPEENLDMGEALMLWSLATDVIASIARCLPDPKESRKAGQLLAEPRKTALPHPMTPNPA